jgi:hypothetical protein
MDDEYEVIRYMAKYLDHNEKLRSAPGGVIPP